MKKILTLLAFSTILFGATNVVVSVIPQSYFVKKIGGDKVNVSIMVPKGKSPEIYEPLPSQMRSIKKADLYFGIGMPFESKWKRRFNQTNPRMKFVDITQNMEKMTFSNDGQDHAGHNHGDYDPHVWNSIALSKIHAQNVYNELAKIDIKNIATFRANLNMFLKEIDTLDAQIKEILQEHKGKAFAVYHPAWGYFAKEYFLQELSIQEGGKDTKSSNYAALINTIKEKNIKTIFIQPEFSKKRVKSLADNLKLQIVELDPLPEIWDQGMLDLARKIAQN